MVEVLRTRKALPGRLAIRIRRVFPPLSLTRKLSVGKHRIPPQIGSLHHAAQCFSQVRRERMPVMQSVFRHDEFAIGIEYNKIRIVARGKSALARVTTS